MGETGGYDRQYEMINRQITQDPPHKGGFFFDQLLKIGYEHEVLHKSGLMLALKSPVFLYLYCIVL